MLVMCIVTEVTVEPCFDHVAESDGVKSISGSAARALSEMIAPSRYGWSSPVVATKTGVWLLLQAEMSQD